MMNPEALIAACTIIVNDEVDVTTRIEECEKVVSYYQGNPEKDTVTTTFLEERLNALAGVVNSKQALRLRLLCLDSMFAMANQPNASAWKEQYQAQYQQLNGYLRHNMLTSFPEDMPIDLRCNMIDAWFAYFQKCQTFTPPPPLYTQIPTIYTRTGELYADTYFSANQEVLTAYAPHIIQQMEKVYIPSTGIGLHIHNAEVLERIILKVPQSVMSEKTKALRQYGTLFKNLGYNKDAPFLQDEDSFSTLFDRITQRYNAENITSINENTQDIITLLEVLQQYSHYLSSNHSFKISKDVNNSIINILTILQEHNIPLPPHHIQPHAELINVYSNIGTLLTQALDIEEKGGSLGDKNPQEITGAIYEYCQAFEQFPNNNFLFERVMNRVRQTLLPYPENKEAAHTLRHIGNLELSERITKHNQHIATHLKKNALSSRDIILYCNSITTVHRNHPGFVEYAKKNTLISTTHNTLNSLLVHTANHLMLHALIHCYEASAMINEQMGNPASVDKLVVQQLGQLSSAMGNDDDKTKIIATYCIKIASPLINNTSDINTIKAVQAILTSFHAYADKNKLSKALTFTTNTAIKFQSLPKLSAPQQEQKTEPTIDFATRLNRLNTICDSLKSIADNLGNTQENLDEIRQIYKDITTLYKENTSGENGELLAARAVDILSPMKTIHARIPEYQLGLQMRYAGVVISIQNHCKKYPASATSLQHIEKDIAALEKKNNVLHHMTNGTFPKSSDKQKIEKAFVTYCENIVLHCKTAAPQEIETVVTCLDKIISDFQQNHFSFTSQKYCINALIDITNAKTVKTGDSLQKRYRPMLKALDSAKAIEDESHTIDGKGKLKPYCDKIKSLYQTPQIEPVLRQLDDIILAALNDLGGDAELIAETIEIVEKSNESQQEKKPDKTLKKIFKLINKAYDQLSKALKAETEDIAAKVNEFCTEIDKVYTHTHPHLKLIQDNYDKPLDYLNQTIDALPYHFLPEAEVRCYESMGRINTIARIKQDSAHDEYVQQLRSIPPGNTPADRMVAYCNMLRPHQLENNDATVAERMLGTFLISYIEPRAAQQDTLEDMLAVGEYISLTLLRVSQHQNSSAETVENYQSTYRYYQAAGEIARLAPDIEHPETVTDYCQKVTALFNRFKKDSMLLEAYSPVIHETLDKLVDGAEEAKQTQMALDIIEAYLQCAPKKLKKLNQRKKALNAALTKSKDTNAPTDTAAQPVSHTASLPQNTDTPADPDYEAFKEKTLREHEEKQKAAEKALKDQIETHLAQKELKQQQAPAPSSTGYSIHALTPIIPITPHEAAPKALTVESTSLISSNSDSSPADSVGSILSIASSTDVDSSPNSSSSVQVTRSQTPPSLPSRTPSPQPITPPDFEVSTSDYNAPPEPTPPAICIVFDTRQPAKLQAQQKYIARLQKVNQQQSQTIMEHQTESLMQKITIARLEQKIRELTQKEQQLQQVIPPLLQSNQTLQLSSQQLQQQLSIEQLQRVTAEANLSYILTTPLPPQSSWVQQVEQSPSQSVVSQRPPSPIAKDALWTKNPNIVDPQGELDKARQEFGATLLKNAHNNPYREIEMLNYFTKAMTEQQSPQHTISRPVSPSGRQG